MCQVVAAKEHERRQEHTEMSNRLSEAISSKLELETAHSSLKVHLAEMSAASLMQQDCKLHQGDQLERQLSASELRTQQAVKEAQMHTEELQLVQRELAELQHKLQQSKGDVRIGQESVHRLSQQAAVATHRAAQAEAQVQQQNSQIDQLKANAAMASAAMVQQAGAHTEHTKEVAVQVGLGQSREQELEAQVHSLQQQHTKLELDQARGAESAALARGAELDQREAALAVERSAELEASAVVNQRAAWQVSEVAHLAGEVAKGSKASEVAKGSKASEVAKGSKASEVAKGSKAS